MEKTLLVILGPTGVGKTALSLELAERYDSPIFNADSRQVYRDMSIGTAAPSLEEQARVRHYFVHTLQLTDYFSAARYEEEALRLLSSHFSAHDVALLSGGSMLYIDALCKGIDEVPSVDEAVRASLQQRFECDGLDALCQELQELDPIYAAQADLKNPKRVMRALEVCYITGKPYSSLRKNSAKERPFRIVKIGLNRPREELFARINARVDQMIEAGLVEEARALYPHRALNSLNTVGYKELFAYFDESCSLSEAIEKIKRNSRVYAKKQLTWYKRDEEVTWFHPENQKEELLAYIAEQLQGSEASPLAPSLPLI